MAKQGNRSKIKDNLEEYSNSQIEDINEKENSINDYNENGMTSEAEAEKEIENEVKIGIETYCVMKNFSFTTKARIEHYAQVHSMTELTFAEWEALLIKI